MELKYIVKKIFINSNENKNVIISKWVAVEWVLKVLHFSVVKFRFQITCTTIEIVGYKIKNKMICLKFALLDLWPETLIHQHNGIKHRAAFVLHHLSLQINLYSCLALNFISFDVLRWSAGSFITYFNVSILS